MLVTTIFCFSHNVFQKLYVLTLSQTTNFRLLKDFADDNFRFDEILQMTISDLMKMVKSSLNG